MGDLERAVEAHQAGDLATAERLYRGVLAQQDSHDAYGNLGVVLAARGAFAEAEAAYRRAIALRPRPTTHRRNLALLYLRTRRFPEAVAVLEEVLRDDPRDDRARLSLGNAYLALGRDDGWHFYASRPERLTAAARRLSFPEWLGEPLAEKRLFIMGEQGLGDQIFAARFMRRLAAAEITFAAAPALVRLFSQLPFLVIRREGKLNIAHHDYWTQPLSLPRWALAEPGPYLAATPSRRGGIGVMWKGNDRPDPGRSLPADVARALLARPGVISLQPEDTGATDFLDTAEIIAGLDFVISIDTSVAHLAGALGKPGAVLLQQQSSDWRWRTSNGEHSYWYPSLRVVRQAEPADWSSAVEAAWGMATGLGDRNFAAG